MLEITTRYNRDLVFLFFFFINIVTTIETISYITFLAFIWRMLLTAISCVFFKRLTPTEWEGTKRIVRVTKDCADLTVDILQKTDYGEQMPYR